MVIRSSKMQMDVKSNLYSSLDIIPESDTNKSKQWSKQRSKWTPTSSDQSKMVRNGSKLQKGGKKFQNFQKISINSKKFKNSISFEIFTHSSSKLPMPISGASSGEIRHRLLQVSLHVLLFPFHANFFSFHSQFYFLGQSKVGVLAHMYIGVFSMYRAGHMWKNLPKLHTYAVVLQIVTYAAVDKDF